MSEDQPRNLSLVKNESIHEKLNLKREILVFFACEKGWKARRGSWRFFAFVGMNGSALFRTVVFWW